MDQAKAKQGQELPKKRLVRNTSHPLPRTRVVLEDKEIIISQKPTFQHERQTDSVSFQAPRLQTTLKIPKEIEKVSHGTTNARNMCDMAYSEKVC